jgi:Family of unknown function (DUF6328)
MHPDASQLELEQAQKSEELKERLEREHSELIEELRALIPGAEVLFGFLLAIRFTSQFAELSRGEEYLYFGTLVSVGIALVLFLAPSSHHRLVFRQGDKDYLVRKGNREAIVGTVAMGTALTGAVALLTKLVYGTTVAAPVAGLFMLLIVWRWWALALNRRLAGETGTRSSE